MMCPDHGAVDHVGAGIACHHLGQRLEQSIEHAHLHPAPIAPEHAVPLPVFVWQQTPLRARPRHPQHAFKAETVILRETTPAPALRRQQRPDGRRCPQKSGPGRRLRPGPSHQTGWVRATRPLVARLLTLWLRGVRPLLGRSGPAGSGCLLQLSCIRTGDTLDQAAERRERAEQLCGMGWVDTITHAPL